ncbi:MAG: histidine kinase, partial [Bacteroidota bacterium]
MKKTFWNRKIWFFELREALAVGLLYIIFAILYHVTLWINRGGYQKERDPLFNWVDFMDGSGVQYIIFFLVTIPIWILNFKILKRWKLVYRLLSHLITLPLFIFVSLNLYHLVCDWLDFFYLKGQAQIWDIYIPGLFYIVQFGVFHGYEYFLEHQRKLKLEGELRQVALKSELSAIKAQLNPHFLYNIFNTINASIPGENEHTRNMIAQLSDLFRYQLKASQQDLVTLKDELDFITKYLELEQARFGDRLKVEINVAEELYSEKIPPMLLQPLIENSVKHGLSSIIEGGTISITIFKENDRLKFEIADTG